MDINELKSHIDIVYPEAFRTVALERCHLIKEDGNMYRNRPTDKSRCETFCGSISPILKNLLKDKGVNLRVVNGIYVGPGCELSEDGYKGAKEIHHAWTILEEDGTIIDGSHSQFRERINYPNPGDRVLIVPPNDPRQNWYKEYNNNLK